jgi:hypothetical protein
MRPGLAQRLDRELATPRLVLWCLLVGALVWITALPQLGGPGITWDEAYYYPTFVDVRHWTGLLFSDPAAALSPDGIHAGWHRINELPPLLKWLGAAATMLPASGWWHLGWVRLVPAVCFAATLLLLISSARRLGLQGRWSLLPAAVYTAHPVLLGHAQLAASETIFAMVTALAVRVGLLDQRRWSSRLLLFAVVGLAVATKVNGLILAGVVACWLALLPLFDAHRRAAGGVPVMMARGAALGLAIVAAAPLLAWLIWPWMWHDTVARIAAYRQFIVDHPAQGMWFLGQRHNFGGPPVPVWYPVAIIHLVTPIGLLLLGWGGIAALAAVAVRRRSLRPGPLLLLGLATAPLLAASLPGTPRYDGIRLFLPVFVPLVLLLALGLRSLVAMRRRWRLGRVVVVLAVASLLLVRPSIDYYNLPTRLATRGESIFPFEQTFWCNAVDAKAVSDLSRLLPPGARVKALALQVEGFLLLQEWGLLPASINFTGPPPYDFHLLQTRRGFWGNTEWLLYSQCPPIAAWGRGPNGEPLLTLFGDCR